MRIRPLGNRVIIEPRKVEEKTKGGIYLPESAQESDPRGTVVAVSDAIKDCPFSVGDSVMYDKYAGKKISDNEKEYVIVDFKDVIAKLSE